MENSYGGTKAGLGFEVVEKKGSVANLSCGIFYEPAFLFFVSWRNRSHN
jgi:hypothetical protein